MKKGGGGAERMPRQQSKMRTVLNHFKKIDPVLFQIMNGVEFVPIRPRKTSEFYSALCREIIGQQLHQKAARAIFKKFTGLFLNSKIIPEQALKLDSRRLRGAGLSWAKVRAAKDLAEKVTTGRLNLEELVSLDDAQVVERLTAVRGVGPWTSEMFLMFTLGREDVFSHRDLGLRKAIIKHYGLRKEPAREQLDSIVRKWSPYRTYACRALWQATDALPE